MHFLSAFFEVLQKKLCITFFKPFNPFSLHIVITIFLNKTEISNTPASVLSKEKFPTEVMPADCMLSINPA